MRLRNHILKAMTDVISGPGDLKDNAPRIVTTTVPKEKIGTVIGPSGKHIKWIIEKTGTEVSINDDGVVSIFSTDLAAAEEAKELAEMMANGVTVGKTYEGEVVKILEGVGAIVELIPGQSGLVHISQIAYERVEDVEKFVEIGETIKVKVLEVDNFKGRISLSIKALQEPPEGYVEEKREPRERSSTDNKRYSDRDRKPRGRSNKTEV